MRPIKGAPFSTTQAAANSSPTHSRTDTAREQLHHFPPSHPSPRSSNNGGVEGHPVCFMVVALVTALLAAPGAVEAATCSPTQLPPCAPATIGNAASSAACCGKLKAHPASCLCKYKKDPNLQRYVNSRNGKKVFAACKLHLPRC
ncbi:hypothetical protein CFC21_008668 [Triticum aestivum]|uniref:Bifunctional inhibitor/plant lipid transfer protein/seed storage helical domain-containing protein n=2 Tax=Triticum aestivum TaxID=4565 RepID=A0A3B5Z469_WHEAT|nr:hypothetical protein CFC21_008668 [Triticum aestivum]